MGIPRRRFSRSCSRNRPRPPRSPRFTRPGCALAMARVPRWPVKVQRPGIRATVEQDLDILLRLAVRLEDRAQWARAVGAAGPGPRVRRRHARRARLPGGGTQHGGRDLLPEEFTSELAQLQDRAEPARWEQVEEVMAQSLGAPTARRHRDNASRPDAGPAFPSLCADVSMAAPQRRPGSRYPGARMRFGDGGCRGPVRGRDTGWRRIWRAGPVVARQAAGPV